MNPLAAHRQRTKIGMSVRAEIILDLCYINPRPMTYSEVKQLATDEQVGSAVMLHNAIHWLVDNDYLKESISPIDHRSKLLEVTRLGVKYLSK